jgi:hypothetical protein
MRLEQIIERLERVPEGAIITNQNRYDFWFLVSVLDEYRAAYLKDNYQKNKRLNPASYQKHYPRFKKELRTDCYTAFESPSVISLDKVSDGLRYFGTNTQSGVETDGFIRIHSRAELSNMNNHKVMNVRNNRNTYFMLDSSAGLIEVYGKNWDIEEVLEEAIFASPVDVPTFNWKLDQYPIEEDAIPTIIQMIFMGVTRISAATAPVPAFTAQNVPK